VFRGFDLAVLWGSLGVGLLVMETGTFLAPLGLRLAAAAVVVGSLVGVAMLAAAGRIGAAEGVPSMVLLRAVLGVRGSLLPTALNVLQLIGWTAFELWVMGHAAAVIAPGLLGVDGPLVWIVVFAAWSTLLALGGPLAMVRQWLEKFGVWAMLAASLYLTVRLVASVDLGALLAEPGDGGGFWGLVDLVIVMPISWLPLVADYNRFAKSPGGATRGTFAGYLVANIWFYLLGVLFVLANRMPIPPSPAELATGIAGLGGGALALAAILLDETDNVFADIYSAAVSSQNALAAVPQRALVVAVGLLGTVLAAGVEMIDYFSFLALIGSVFVPLFGLLLADYYLVRRGAGYDTAALYRERGAYWYNGGVNLPAAAVWAVGVLVYLWAAAPDSLPPALAGFGAGLPVGATLPSFLTTAALYTVLARLGLVAGASTAAVDRPA
jgi:putative hydroxymethylpyrimidine transporter CytX